MSARSCPWFCHGRQRTRLNSTPILSTPPPFPQKDIGYTIANPSKPGTTFGFRGKFFELESPVITSKYSEVGLCLACLSV